MLVPSERLVGANLGAERFPGMTITYALIQMLEKVAEHTNNTKAKIICKARVYKLLQNSAGAVVGCEYELGGKAMQEHAERYK